MGYGQRNYQPKAKSTCQVEKDPEFRASKPVFCTGRPRKGKSLTLDYLIISSKANTN